MKATMAKSVATGNTAPMLETYPLAAVIADPMLPLADATGSMPMKKLATPRITKRIALVIMATMLQQQQQESKCLKRASFQS